MSDTPETTPARDLTRIGRGKPGPGRPKGSENKVTGDFRKAVNLLLENNSENFEVWLAKVAETDPAKALDLVTKIAEYAAPKLSRTEVTGLNGDPVEVVSRVELVSGDGEN